MVIKGQTYKNKTGGEIARFLGYDRNDVGTLIYTPNQRKTGTTTMHRKEMEYQITNNWELYEENHNK